LEIATGDYALVAAVAFCASTLAAISGYGTGLILPLVLVPVIGAEATVPVMGIASFFINASRVAAFWRAFDFSRAAIIFLAALPTCILGAWAYTLLSGRGAALVIGLALLVLVPARRWLGKLHGRISAPWLAGAGAGFGFLEGSTPGVGVVLISLLLAAGLHGSAVIATDAGISVLLALTKTIVFQTQGVLTASAWAMAGLIGAVSLPAAFLARRIVPRISARFHIVILDAVVVVGALLLIARGLSLT
jgi:uncharacterized membrane protein YfcA